MATRPATPANASATNHTPAERATSAASAPLSATSGYVRTPPIDKLSGTPADSDDCCRSNPIRNPAPSATPSATKTESSSKASTSLEPLVTSGEDVLRERVARGVVVRARAAEGGIDPFARHRGHEGENGQHLVALPTVREEVLRARARSREREDLGAGVDEPSEQHLLALERGAVADHRAEEPARETLARRRAVRDVRRDRGIETGRRGRREHAARVPARVERAGLQRRAEAAAAGDARVHHVARHGQVRVERL